MGSGSSGNHAERAILLEVRDPVRRFLRRLIAEPSLAEDAESETVLALIQRLRAGLQIRRPVPFALQVAWTKAIDEQRRLARNLRVPAPKPTFGHDPARVAEVKDWLESGLAMLEPVERALLHLRYVEDQSYRELAEVLGEPIGTIGRRLHEARLSLRRNLEKSSGEPVPESMLAGLLPLLRPDGPAPPPAPQPLPRWTGAPPRVAPVPKLLALGLVAAVGAGAWLLVPSEARPRSPSATPSRSPIAAPRVAEAASVAAPPREAELLPALAIAGRVVDEAGRGVPGATVRWTPSAGAHGTGSVPADADGSFRIEPPAELTLLDLAAAAQGFAATMRDDVGVGAADVVLRLGRGLAIGGVVATLAGDPVAGASVTYHARVGDHRIEVTTTSDRDGRYALAHLPLDPVLTRPDAGALEIRADGHAPQIKPVGLALPGGDPGSLTIDVWLARGAVVEGTVRDESGAPIAGATVEVWTNAALETPARPGGFPMPRPNPVEARLIAETQTDAAGRYRCEHVPVRIAGIEPGSRYAPFAKRDRPFLSGGLVASAPGRATAGAAIPIASADEAVIAVDVALRPEVVLRGSVRDERGEPVAGAEVRAHLEAGDVPQHAVTSPDRIRGRAALGTATTGADGGWELGGLPRPSAQGVLAITAAAPGHALKRLLLDGERGSDGPLVIELADARTVRGVVVDERGAPVPGAVVRIVDADAAERQRAVTATRRDGGFEIASSRQSGAVDLRIDAAGFAQARLQVPEATVQPLRVTLARERILRGTVRSPEGRPVAGALVTAVPRTPQGGVPTHDDLELHRELAYAETLSDTSGAFVLAGLPPDPVCLWAGVPWPRSDGLMGLLFSRKFAVVMPEPAAPAPAVVTLPYRTERGTLSVRAVDSASKTPVLHGLSGTLIASDGMIGGLGMFAGPGLLVFHAVPAGTYRVLVDAEGYPRLTTAEVEIGAPASPPEIRVALGRGVRLAGRVRHAGPLPPGRLTLRGVADAKGAAPLDVRCNEDGSFEVDGLAAGSWRIWAELQERGRPIAMITRPEELVLEIGAPRSGIELRLLPVQQATLRVSGLFAEGQPPTTAKSSASFADTVRRFAQFRLRCRDADGVRWIDTLFETLPYAADDRDVILHLPLPEGTYEIAIDHGPDEVASGRITSPGTAALTLFD